MKWLGHLSWFALGLLLSGCGDGLESQAEAGDAVAQYQVALKVEKSDPAKAHKFLLLSAAKGNLDAQYTWGQRLLTGAPSLKADPSKGIFWIQKAATAGHEKSKRQLVLCYAQGIGVAPNLQTAWRWLTLPAVDLDPEVNFRLGEAIVERRILGADTEKGLQLLKQAAESGQAKAMIKLAKLKYAENTVAPDYEHILPYLQKAAESKEPEACRLWGLSLLRGEGQDADPEAAFTFLRRAAELKDSEAACHLYWELNSGKNLRHDPGLAFRLLQGVQGSKDGLVQYLLARCYHYGQGVAVDSAKELLCLETGKQLGDPDCAGALGYAYRLGLLGLPKSPGIASKLYLEAAHWGRRDYFYYAAVAIQETGNQTAYLQILSEGVKAKDFRSMNAFALLLEKGSADVAKNPARAFDLYSEVAEQGNLYAKAKMAELLIDGNGVAEDAVRGVQLLKEAAVADQTYAQALLAACLSSGKGCDKDEEEAYFWAYLAAAQSKNDNYAKFRDKLAGELTSASRAKIVALCRSWMEKKKTETNEDEEDKGGAKAGGTGSGLIFSNTGLVLTNHHVIAGCKKFTVITSSGEKLSASLVASDAKLDVAVLRLSKSFKPTQFPSPPALVSSGGVKSGEKVFTIGHPLAGLLSTEAKYNEGSVSALSGMRDDRNIMQISVPIQPGNSGGPLANNRGEVVGLIVATVNGSALLRQQDILAQNINFAIKSDPILAFLRAQNIPTGGGVLPSDPVEHVKAYSVKIISQP
jgi:TPR repeat protein